MALKLSDHVCKNKKVLSHEVVHIYLLDQDIEHF